MDSGETGRGGGSPRLVVVLAMAVVGALFTFEILSQDVRNLSLSWADLPRGEVIWYFLAMAAGGAIAGALLAALFGRGGALGWLLALLGGVLGAMIAGLLGSFLGMVPDLFATGWQTADLIKIGAGLLVPVFALVGRPLLVISWLVLIALAHLLAKRGRG